MKRLSFYCAVLFSLLLIRCVPQENAGNEDEGTKVTDATTSAPVSTIEAVRISAISAVLKGAANPPSTVTPDFELGVQFSKSSGILPSNCTTVVATDADSEYNYSVGVTGLEPSTKYYYRCYLSQNGKQTYGETKEFTTESLQTLIETKDVSEIKPSSAYLNAKLDLKNVIRESSSYGFLWGASEDSVSERIPCQGRENNSFSYYMSGLEHRTQYWYQSYVILDGKEFTGELKSFTTDYIPVDHISISAKHLSMYSIGSQLTLTAGVYPTDATDRRFSWSSDNESVATVDENGVVLALDNGDANIIATTFDGNKTASCSITVAQCIRTITLDKSNISLMAGESTTISVVSISPENAWDKSYTWKSTNPDVATVDENGIVCGISEGETVIRAVANDAYKNSASCTVFVRVPFVFEAVDLGLSVKWANANLGANAPEEAGDYYAWGEVETFYQTLDPLTWKNRKKGYNLDSYTWYWADNNWNCYRKYTDNGTFKDRKYNLDPEDDVVQVSLGGSWRMPSADEVLELVKKCKWTWTTRFGVLGMLATGPNGNSIFIPAAGAFNDKQIKSTDYNGFFWTSKRYTDSQAYCFLLNPIEVFANYTTDRYFGLSIRAVTE